MPIGRFSNACRLSVKALRHYDEVGLLKPAFTDPDTGYRYYGKNQARDAVLIAMLRSMEIPLTAIRSLLVADDDELKQLLAVERARIASEVSRQQRILNSIERISRQGTLTPYTIGIRVEPPYHLASMHCTTTAEDIVHDSSELMYRLFDELTKANVQQQAPCMCINEPPNKSGAITVRACVGLLSGDSLGEPVEVVDVPGGPAAWLTHVGSYEELGIAYHALSAWIQEHGHDQRDSLREIYYNDPAHTETEALKTEVLVPIHADSTDRKT